MYVIGFYTSCSIHLCCFGLFVWDTVKAFKRSSCSVFRHSDNLLRCQGCSNNELKAQITLKIAQKVNYIASTKYSPAYHCGPIRRAL